MQISIIQIVHHAHVINKIMIQISFDLNLIVLKIYEACAFYYTSKRTHFNIKHTKGHCNRHKTNGTFSKQDNESDNNSTCAEVTKHLNALLVFFLYDCLKRLKLNVFTCVQFTMPLFYSSSELWNDS